MLSKAGTHVKGGVGMGVCAEGSQSWGSPVPSGESPIRGPVLHLTVLLQKRTEAWDRSPVSLHGSRPVGVGEGPSLFGGVEEGNRRVAGLPDPGMVGGHIRLHKDPIRLGVLKDCCPSLNSLVR